MLDYQIVFNAYKGHQHLREERITVRAKTDEDSRQARNAVLQGAQDHAAKEGWMHNTTGAGFRIDKVVPA